MQTSKHIYRRIQPSNANELPSATMNKQQTITLPWISGLSPNVRYVYKKAGYKAVFKCNHNLTTLQPLHC